MERTRNILDFGASGDGIHDDSAAFCAALAGGNRVLIPAGEYCIKRTLTVGSDTIVTADENAHIRLADGAQKGRRDFLLTTDPTVTTRNVSISGGVWDGNCEGNDRGKDLFNPTATTGTLFNFRRVLNLRLSRMTVKNPLCYYFRFCEAEHVTLSDIRFASDALRSNQDGVHLAGYCRHFVIENLYGIYGSPNDDFIALNADDALTRQENFDLVNGPIEDITVRNLRSERCHCFLRLLSVTSPINNVSVRGVTGTCLNCAVNMDMARGCRVPLFREENVPNGVGNIRSVEISGVNIAKEDHDNALFSIQGNVSDFVMKNVKLRDYRSEQFSIAHLAPHRVTVTGIERYGDAEIVSGGIQTDETDLSGVLSPGDSLSFRCAGFDSLTLDRIG